MAFKIGSLVDGRYRITARIGHGGTAEVYEANDIYRKKIVALKIIREEITDNPINLKRFNNETTIAASLTHPNIVKVYDNGYIDGLPYIVNEYIKGQTLKDLLDFRGSLSLQEALDYMIQLSSALLYAHQHFIIHRDVKPDNIFILPDGSIKLGDFGIAQIDTGNKIENEEKDILGSVYYLAPEISQGNPATPQSDIYAAGVTLYEMLTGKVPFIKDKAIDIAVAHIKEKFPSIRKILPNCPKEIERIINKCTKKNPKERYNSAKDLVSDLQEIKNNPELLKEKKSFFSRLFGFK